MDESDVATAMLELHGLRAKITVPNMMRTLGASSRGPHTTTAKGIVKTWLGNGWLSGNEKQGFKMTKEGLGIIRKKVVIEEWVEEAEKLIEKIGEQWLPNIKWKDELKHHPEWFKVARYPWLKDSRFYLRGINNCGEEKPSSPPEDGWVEGEAPFDWEPLEG